MSYVTVPLQLNAEALVEEVFAQMEAEYPGWTPAPGNFETRLIRSLVYVLIQPLAQLASDVADEIFNRYGEEIAKVLPKEAVPASAKVKITVQDTAGYPIPEGTQIDLYRTGGEGFGFRTTEAVEVPPGQTSISEVTIEAIDAGTEQNSLEGDAELVDALAYITAVELEGSSGGGEDAEEPSEYLARLAETMQTFADRPIIGRDVAILARKISGVHRVAVRDNYNSNTNEDEQEKTTSMGLMAADGSTVTATAKEEVEALLESKREVNYVFIVEDPDYNPIDVKATVVPEEGWSQADAVANTKAMLEDLLNPARFSRGPQGDSTVWVFEEKLRYQDVVTAINNTEGVDHYALLEIRKEGGVYGTGDVTLSGNFPTTEPNTLTIS